MVTLEDIPFSLNTEILLEKYRIRPGSDDARAFVELVGKVQEIGKPKALYCDSFIDEKGDDSVIIDGVRFTSTALRRNLDSVERVFPYVATCGREVDSIGVSEEDILRKIWLFMLKGVLLETAMERMYEHINTHRRVAKLSTINPGSGDVAVWPIEQQKELFSIFKDVEKLIGVRLTESLLMIPDVSVSGILFPTETDFQSCQLCHRDHCPNRRAPFSQEVWESIYGN
jgi:hypothetical protein